MKCFQLIKSILDEAYDEIEESEKDTLIKDALISLSEQYGDLSIKSRIDYSNPITRFAYIYKYVTCHANLVYKFINDYSPVFNVFDFDNESVDVACIGGGPGSDFLGILKYLMINGKKSKVHFKLYDKEKAWGDSWEEVVKKLIRNLLAPIDGYLLMLLILKIGSIIQSIIRQIYLQ